MAIFTTCPNCDRQLRIPESRASRRYRCTRCGTWCRLNEDDEAEVVTPARRSHVFGIVVSVLVFGLCLVSCLLGPKQDAPPANPPAEQTAREKTETLERTATPERANTDGMSEAKRKEVYLEMQDALQRAADDAAKQLGLRTGDDLEDARRLRAAGQKYADLQEQLTKQYLDEIDRKYTLTSEQAVKILEEGEEKRWLLKRRK